MNFRDERVNVKLITFNANICIKLHIISEYAEIKFKTCTQHTHLCPANELFIAYVVDYTCVYSSVRPDGNLARKFIVPSKRKLKTNFYHSIQIELQHQKLK